MFNRKKIDNEGVNEIIYLSKNILKVLYIALIASIILCVVFIFKNLGIFKILFSILKVLAPLFIGFVIAWLFNPIVNKLEEKGVKRKLGSIIVYIVFIAFLLIFFKIFIPVLYNQINELIKYIPSLLNDINNFISKLFNKIELIGVDVETVKENILDTVNSLGVSLTKNLPQNIVGILTKVVSGIGTILFGMMIGLYMLMDFNNISVHILKFIPKKHQKEITKLISDIGTGVRKSVNGTLLVASVVFVCDTIGFSIAGLNGALLFGLFCGITDLIPYIGPFLGTIAATIVGFSQGILTGVIVLIIAIVVQMLENYIFQPLVMSKATNLRPVTIICGLLVFGYFFGIIGMILSTPLLSLGKVIINFCEEKYKIQKEKKELVVES